MTMCAVDGLAAGTVQSPGQSSAAIFATRCRVPASRHQFRKHRLSMRVAPSTCLEQGPTVVAVLRTMQCAVRIFGYRSCILYSGYGISGGRAMALCGPQRNDHDGEPALNSRP